jgi:hypothetical protein
MKLLSLYRTDGLLPRSLHFVGRLTTASFRLSTAVFFPPIPPYVHIDFVVPPPGCSRSVTDFWGWGAHRAQLRCPDDVSDDMCEREAPGGALNLSSTSYPDHGRCGDLTLQGKIPTAEPGIEPGTSWLVVRRSDHQATRLICPLNYYQIYFNTYPQVQAYNYITLSMLRMHFWKYCLSHPGAVHVPPISSLNWVLKLWLTSRLCITQALHSFLLLLKFTLSPP